MNEVTIVDYNMGNLASVANAIQKIGAKANFAKTKEDILKSKKLILPGVGAFGEAMEHLRENGLDVAITEYARSGRELLGICLGMQLLFEKSEEFGAHEGLGLIPGSVVKFDESRFSERLKIPQMGWNKLFVNKDHFLFNGLDKEMYLYFVHSYHAQCDEEYIIGKTLYGYEFPSAVAKDNVCGFQPHPEKSHEVGLEILKNYIEKQGR